MKLAEKITMLRKRAGLSQEELAEKLKVSRQAVSRWEQGAAVPDTANVVQLARLFGVATDFLLLDEQEEPFTNQAATMPYGADGVCNHKKREIMAVIVAAAAVLGMLAMGIISSVVFLDQGYNYSPGFEFFARFPIFLEQYNLAWLFTLLAAMLLAAVGILVGERLRKKK